MSKYVVTINQPRSFSAEQRVRAGIVVSREHGYEGELTEEQLDAIKADRELTVVAAKAEGKQAEKPAAKAKRKVSKPKS